ncbi:hypothetical protein H5J24_11955 [Chryseobacterium capnotolerans]|uniref:hypothetical protein n=1 Tax=Chryseobacterium capnotolerans TaxID=2759528 RepID=UPI001E52E1EF|nr:hypothetical protein [Chryseobacterium capnotolerans]UHO40601.1 hypothetical protein H5J24_11955 [Chryseobacterium capnotolerans]
MSLQIKYSTEIAKELGKIAVYLPGEIIEVGDIIKFPYGKTGFLKKKLHLVLSQKFLLSKILMSTIQNMIV